MLSHPTPQQHTNTTFLLSARWVALTTLCCRAVLLFRTSSKTRPIPYISPDFARFKLKQRLKEEGNETVTNCHRLKLHAADGNIKQICHSYKYYYLPCLYKGYQITIIVTPSVHTNTFKLSFSLSARWATLIRIGCNAVLYFVAVKQISLKRLFCCVFLIV